MGRSIDRRRKSEPRFGGAVQQGEIARLLLEIDEARENFQNAADDTLNQIACAIENAIEAFRSAMAEYEEPEINDAIAELEDDLESAVLEARMAMGL